MADVKGPMLPPSRPVGREHTPQPSLLSGSDGPLLDDGRPRLSFSSTLPSVSSLPDLKKAGAKRPKFVARASQYLIGTYGKSKEPNYFADIELKRASEPVPLEQIINSLQHELLANPLKPLGVERNGSLLRILEGYVSLQKERDLLAGKLRETVKRHDRNVDILEDERKEWKQNKEIFKAEIKRFEIVVAEGRTGLSQVALARQQSLMRGRAKAIGRPRRSSSKSEAAKGYASTASSKSSKELKVQVIRPTTPSQEMSTLSKEIKARRSFLSLDLLPERPSSRLRGLSLADVDIPKRWRKKSKAASTAPSIASSPSKTVSSDFSSDGGDLLPDELEQQQLDAQAIQHVAKLISVAHGSDIAENVNLLEEHTAHQTSLHTLNDPTPRPRRPPAPLNSRSGDDMPTIWRPSPKNLALRRGNDPMSIKIENTRPATTTSHHSRRPFSFYAGDDQSIMSDLRRAPPNLAIANSLSSHSSQSSKSSPDVPLRRHSSLIPGPVPEHVMARPRREDSSWSVITSLQRSPLGGGGGGRPLSFGAGGSSGSVTRVSSVSVLGDRTNDRTPVTPRIGGVRSTMTAVKGKASVQSLVQDLEMKGKDGGTSEGGSGSGKEKGKKAARKR